MMYLFKLLFTEVLNLMFVLYYFIHWGAASQISGWVNLRLQIKLSSDRCFTLSDFKLIIEFISGLMSYFITSTLSDDQSHVSI